MIGLKLTCMKFLLAGVLSFIVFPLVAADRYSVATGNWNSTSTWSATHGGASGASIPTSSDIVYIDNGYTVTVDAASACQSIQIGGTTSGYGNGTIVFGGSFTLTVSGIVTIGNSAAGTTGSINMSSGTLACTGFTVNNGGTWTYGTGTIQLTANNTLPTSWLTTFYRLTVSAGTTTNNGNITVNNALSGAGGLTQAANATLNLGGTSGITTLTATASGNTVNYSGAAQTVHANNYYNLILSGSAAKTLQAGTTTIGGNLTLNGTATVTTVAGLTISGNLAIGDGTTFTAAGFALTVSGTATIGAGTSGLLSISSATAAKTFTGLVTVAPGATWNNSGNSPVTIRGGITNNGTFTAGSGIYTFDTNAQALTGTLSIPSITVTTITLTNNNTLTVGTALSGTGGLTQAVNATLNLGGTSGITTLTATASGNTVNFTGASQSVNAASYYNLTISGSSASAAGNIVVAGTLALTSGVLSIGPNTLSLSNGANLSYGSGSLTGGATSNLTIGTGTAITLNAISGGLNNFNISRNITLGADLTVNGTLTLTSGSFAVGNYTLTLNGPTIAGTPSNLSTTSSSNLVFGGTSSGVLIPTSVAALNGLSITNTNIVTLQSSPTISGTFNPAGAGLSIGANTLTLNGQINCGTLVGGASSNIIIGNAGSASLPAVTLNNLTINRAGGVSMCGNVIVGGTLNLSSGAFTVGAYTLTLNGPTIAGTPSNLSTTSSSNLVFGGSSSGVQVPSSVANLNNLTVNNSSGITLNGTVTVASILTMTQGNISTGTYTLILSSSAAGALSRASGTIIGRLRRAVNTPLSTDYTFPVGTVASYRPAVMNFSALASATNITAEFIATPPSGFVSYIDDIAYLSNIFTEGYWRFSSSSTPAVTYSLKLTGNGFISYTINDYTRITGRDNGNTTWRALGVHGSRTGNDISRNGVSNLNATSFDFALAAGCNATFLGYGYERNITIDYTKIAGGSDLYSFPVMVRLTGQDFLKTSPAGQIFNANGYDIVFTDDSYNKLDHQTEYYNGTNGDLIAWVRIPTLSCSSNTVIKILYGNPQITTDPSVTSVWDSHYRGVWHLDDNNLNDFTSYNKAGTPYNTPTYPAGMINNGLGLNGINEYVQVNNDPNINFAGNVTVSAWVKMDTRNRDQKIAGNQNDASGGYKFGIYTNNKVEFEIRNSANTPSLNRDVAGGTVLNTGQWYYLAGISSDILDSIKTFVNGISERPFKKTGTLGVASDNLVIGKEPFQSSFYFDGTFDELRISDRVRSDGWLRTEYNNQSSPSTFYILDANAVLTNNLPSAGICTAPITLTFGSPAGGTYSGNPYIAGNVFTPPSAGSYAITYTYDAGCGPIIQTKNIIITPIPPAPAAPNREYCTNQITYLQATNGKNIRWYSGGTLVSTANPFSTGQTVAGIYTYTVTQTINGCESPATTVTLTIYNGITINNQPQPATICPGDNAVFTVSASGYNLSYRWQEDGVNLSDGGIYSGTTTSTLTLSNPGLAKNGKQYRCVVSTTCGASPANSNAALLTVNTSFTWTGAVSSDWNSTENWSCGQVPTPIFSATIPNVANKPVLSSGATGTVNNLTVDPGSTLTISGNTIQIGGSITNNGTFTATDGTVELNGASAQSIGSSVFSSNTIKNLTINNSSGVSLLGPLSVTGIVNVQSGTLSSGGNLTLASTASGTALINGSGAGSVTGNVTMQRYLPSGFGYKYFSSPFQSATVNEFGDDMDLTYWFPTFYSFDENSVNSGWIDYTNTSGTLDPLHGYAVNFGSDPAAKTIDVTGVVNNGSQSATFYNHNNTYTLGFNLAGNPYPSPIDWDAASGWTKTNIDDAIYYFKASTTDEYGGTYSSYVNKTSSDGLATATIPSMQSFFIHVSDGTYPVTGTLAMDNNVRITDLTHAFLKSDEKGTIQFIRLSATSENDTTASDPLVVYFDEKASAFFDGNLDALKLMNSDYFVPNFYTIGIDGKKMSIDARPAGTSSDAHIKLGLDLNLDGYIIFRINNIGTDLSCNKVSITDLASGKEQDLLHGGVYRVFLTAGEYQDRFVLNLSETATVIPETGTGNDLFSVYATHRIIKMQLNLDGKTSGNHLTITNLTGQIMIIKKNLQTGYQEFDSGLKDGFYIVTFTSGNYSVSRKILIKNL